MSIYFRVLIFVDSANLEIYYDWNSQKFKKDYGFSMAD